MMTIWLVTFMTSALVKLYLHYHRQLIDLQHQKSTNDDVRDVVNLLKNDISRAGYIGCAKLTSEFEVNPYQQYSLTIKNALELSSGRLTVRYQEFPGAIVMRNMEDHYQILVNRDIELRGGDILLISDCLHAEIFRASFVEPTTDGQIITSDEPLKYKYLSHAEVGRFIVSSFYLGAAAPDMHVNNRSLLHANTNGEEEVLIEHVSQLHFTKNNGDVHFSLILDKKSHVKTWSGMMQAGL